MARVYIIIGRFLIFCPFFRLRSPIFYLQPARFENDVRAVFLSALKNFAKFQKKFKNPLTSEKECSIIGKPTRARRVLFAVGTSIIEN